LEDRSAELEARPAGIAALQLRREMEFVCFLDWDSLCNSSLASAWAIGPGLGSFYVRQRSPCVRNPLSSVYSVSIIHNLKPDSDPRRAELALAKNLDRTAKAFAIGVTQAK